MRVVYPLGDHVTHTPTPIRWAFSWQQWSTEQCSRSQGRSWNGSFGGGLGSGCVPLTGSVSALTLFVRTPAVQGCPSEKKKKKRNKRGAFNTEVVGCGLISPGPVNYFVKALLLPQQVSPAVGRRWRAALCWHPEAIIDAWCNPGMLLWRL